MVGWLAGWPAGCFVSVLRGMYFHHKLMVNAPFGSSTGDIVAAPTALALTSYKECAGGAAGGWVGGGRRSGTGTWFACACSLCLVGAAGFARLNSVSIRRLSAIGFVPGWHREPHF